LIFATSPSATNDGWQRRSHDNVIHNMTSVDGKGPLASAE